MKRGCLKTNECTLVAFWLPADLVRKIDQRVRAEDTDRSKFIRGCIRKQLDDLGIKIANAS